jgi:hypothetical protein
MCSLRFENNLLTIEGVRFASISKNTPLSKLSFAFVSLSLPLLESTNSATSASSLTLTTLNPKYNEMERRKLQVSRRVIRELRAITRCENVQKLFCNNDGTAVFYFPAMQADAATVREFMDDD